MRATAALLAMARSGGAPPAMARAWDRVMGPWAVAAGFFFAAFLTVLGTVFFAALRVDFLAAWSAGFDDGFFMGERVMVRGSR